LKYTIKTLFLLLVCSVISGGCNLSPKRAQEVDERIAAKRQSIQTCTPGHPDRCAQPSALLALGSGNRASGKHHVTLVEYGEDALKIRIHLIRAARRSIEMQNFILRKDVTGEMVMTELLAAARRGVQVRLLLDQLFTVSDMEYLVQLTMAHSNFGIRFYNPTFDKAKTTKGEWLGGVACCFRNINQRMHNKLLVADDLVGITGGRNIADRYFDYDTNYNFKDRDIAVFGRVAEEMRHSFDAFWESPITVPVEHLRDVAEVLLNGGVEPLNAFEPPERLLPLMQELQDQDHIAERFVDTAYPIERLAYFSDLPRKAAPSDPSQSKAITRGLYEVLSSAQHTVVIQSPYMVLSGKARKLFGSLKVKNADVELVFSTNSLAATDADTVYANTHKHKKHYVKTLGFKMYEYKPYPADAPLFFPRWGDLIDEKKRGVKSMSVVSGDNSTIDMPAPRTGLHAKTFVVDGKITMIGSHNFDPRSEGFNTENGVVIWDEAFAKTVEGLIRRDIKPGNSWVVAVKPDVNEVGSVIESVSRTLPIFDLWPYRSTTVFELAPGGTPVEPGAPGFYKNYHSVGSFPDVIRTRRQVTVMFLSSFFGFLSPIL
jgi:phosphatidylserine/phosphatidylglycerophosphate/cardiolipin synthase-like enzyme